MKQLVLGAPSVRDTTSCRSLLLVETAPVTEDPHEPHPEHTPDATVAVRVPTLKP